MTGEGALFEQLTPYLWVSQSRLYVTNSGIVVDGGQACLIDPGVYPDEIEAIARFVGECGAVTSAIVLTHGHWDHILGPEHFPGVPVIAHEAYAEGMAGERGEHTTEQVAHWQQAAGVERAAPFSLPAADRTFDQASTLRVGSTELRLVHAPGHEVDEIIVYHPETAALWAGDMLSDLEIPFVFHSLLAYQRTLEMIAQWDVQLLVPGHGRPTADVDEIRARLDDDHAYLAGLRERVTQAIGEGRTVGETVALCADMCYKNQDDNLPVHEANVRAAYEELGGGAGWRGDPHLVDVAYRNAGPDDVAAVAQLHAQSWRASYRGILSDEFLDGPILDDRLALWRARLVDGARNQLVLLAEEERVLRGFACAFLDVEPEWGAFLDNLHIVREWQGRGLGRALMAQAGAWVAERRPGMGLYLLVFEENRAARAFYDRLGGQIVERFPYRAVDGTDLVMLRYWWRNAGSLQE
ncbi:MAG: GNAT family N-acetyltransferase [Anaerolineae bacterium]|nr:GNAT family N-acetyltransferase [Anaerolineae bacterium]